jgi:hypothetical protein
MYMQTVPSELAKMAIFFRQGSDAICESVWLSTVVDGETDLPQYPHNFTEAFPN